MRAGEPTPEEAAQFSDTLEQLFRGLEPRARRIIELKLQGWAIPEISAELRIAERTMFRIIERVKGKLQRLRAR